MPLTQRALKDLRALRLKKHRLARGQALVEGARLVGEALNSQAEVGQVLMTADFARSGQAVALESPLHARHLAATTITSVQAEQLADTRQPQGVFAVVALPTEPPPLQRLLRPPILILDHIADPGNLGTLLRTAHWFGLQAVWVSAGSADISSPKVLRGGMGAHFRLPALWQGDLAPLADGLPGAGITVLGASLGSHPLESLSISGDKWALVVGSEARGLGEFWRHRLDQAVSIGGAGRAESLNVAVAAGIILHYLRAG
ncbi:MAG: RNA methyltransferase [Candidatus Neomarinimicrobiota bacterium]